jgi:hypothetical protein
MFDQEAATQRPLHHGKVEAKEDGITEANWVSHLGDAKCVVWLFSVTAPCRSDQRISSAHMYPDYLEFFSSAIAKHGVPHVLERYVFSPEANGNGTLMLARFVGGLVHPYIQAGVCAGFRFRPRVKANISRQFGIEFGQDFMVAQGALTCR